MITQTLDLWVWYVKNQVITTDSRFQGQLHQKPGGHDEHHHSRQSGRDSKGVASWKHNIRLVQSHVFSGVIIEKEKSKQKY